MPVEALPELAAYRDLVMAVAKGLFQARNPGRQRLPKGFEGELRLVMDRVESGSAVPVVSRITHMAQLFPNATDLFDEARDLVEKTISAGAKRDPVPPEVSKEILARFNAFGRTLRDEDSIIVAPPGSRGGAQYDRSVRRRLVLLAQASYEDDVDLVGEVRAADKDAEGFAVRMADGRKIQVRTPPLFLPLALRSLGEAALVRVRGTGLFDAEGALQRVAMATDVSLAEEGQEPPARPGCATPVETQVDALKALGAGWYDESSKAYDMTQLDWLARLLKGLLDGFQLPNPYLYPTPEGMTRAEWSGPQWEVVLNVDLDAKAADVIAARIDSDEVHELPVALGDVGAEIKLGRFLLEHLRQPGAA